MPDACSLSLAILGLFRRGIQVFVLRYGAPGPPIILISVDTLRADHLNLLLGSRGRRTPNIDAIANGGTLFSQANAQVPLTLPSHVSLLSSPIRSQGIEDNGQLCRQAW